MESPKIIVIVILLYVAYMALGRIALHSIKYRDRELEKWIYAAPNILLLTVAIFLWPIVIVYYYVQPERRTKSE